MAVAERRCPYCHDRLGTTATLVCPACHAGYHAECARELGRCAVLGCRTVEWANPRRLRPRDLASVLLAGFAIAGALATPAAVKSRLYAGDSGPKPFRDASVVWFEPLYPPPPPTTASDRYFVTNHASVIFYTTGGAFTADPANPRLEESPAPPA